MVHADAECTDDDVTSPNNADALFNIFDVLTSLFIMLCVMAPDSFVSKQKWVWLLIFKTCPPKNAKYFDIRSLHVSRSYCRPCATDVCFLCVSQSAHACSAADGLGCKKHHFK